MFSGPEPFPKSPNRREHQLLSFCSIASRNPFILMWGFRTISLLHSLPAASHQAERRCNTSSMLLNCVMAEMKGGMAMCKAELVDDAR